MQIRMRLLVPACAIALFLLTAQSHETALFSPQDLRLPAVPGSVRFAVIGDSGTGGRHQYDVGAVMARVHGVFPFDVVLMCGDNIYGPESPGNFRRKFEQPYQALLDRGVKFYAALGNHDGRRQLDYAPFHMNGQRYYSFAVGSVRFCAIDSNDLDPPQLRWIEGELRRSVEPWKICFLHHAPYSSARRHGSQLGVRQKLEPLFVACGVRVAFSGHDHIYERIRPQNGIYYFVSGAAAHLRYRNLRTSPLTASGFDLDRSFMVVEVAGETLHFQTISRTGNTVDSGTIRLAP